jgi:hypothetical protein
MFKLKHHTSFFIDMIPEGNMRPVVSFFIDMIPEGNIQPVVNVPSLTW